MQHMLVFYNDGILSGYIHIIILDLLLYATKIAPAEIYVFSDEISKNISVTKIPSSRIRLICDNYCYI